MKQSRAAKSYAKALFSLAKERHQVDAIAADLEQIVRLLRDAAPLREALTRPSVPASAKRAVAAEAAREDGLSELARDFFALVAAQGRAGESETIASAYRDLADADRGRVRAQVRTAVSFTDAERASLAARLGRELGGKQVIVEETIDANLLGGFIAEVGSLVLDGSLDGQLARLRERLTKGEAAT